MICEIYGCNCNLGLFSPADCIGCDYNPEELDDENDNDEEID